MTIIRKFKSYNVFVNHNYLKLLALEHQPLNKVNEIEKFVLYIYNLISDFLLFCQSITTISDC
jgi:hypothetical protein